MNFTITPAMREKVSGGMPLFSLQRSGFKPNDPFLVDGSPDIAQLPVEIAARTNGRFLAKPVRLLNGKHFGQTRGYGFAHINAAHGSEIEGNDALKAAMYAVDVVRNTTKIYDDGSGRLILQNVGAPKGVAFVELRDDGDYYSIVTVFNGKERGRLIWSGRRLHLSSKGSGDTEQSVTTTAEQSGSPFAATAQSPMNPKQPLETLANQTSNDNIAPDAGGIKQSRPRIIGDSGRQYDQGQRVNFARKAA